MVGQLNDGETFKIPYKVNRIEVKICSFGKTYDSATFELRRDKTFSSYDIEIELGYGHDCHSSWRGKWQPMEFNYPECWQK